MIEVFSLEEICIQMLQYMLILLSVHLPYLTLMFLYVVLLAGGKSVALKTLTARNIATTGCGAFFIDVEGEYTNLTKMLGGKVIKIEQGKSAGVNPFEIEPDSKGNMQFINILDKVAEIRALLGTICRNYGRTLTGTENTEIEVVVNQ